MPIHREHKHDGGAHKFDDAAKWSAVFDNPERDAWQKPDVVMGVLGLTAADTVADIGAGTGYFTVRLARAVPRGKVFAVDVEPNLIAHITKRAETEGLANVVPILGTATDPMLPEPPVAALIVDTAHHIEDRPGYFQALRAQMQPGARVVVVEFRTDRATEVGPPPAMRIAPDALTADMRAAGWQEVAVDTDALPNQYIATYRAP